MKYALFFVLFSLNFFVTSAAKLVDLEKPTEEFFNKYVISGLVDYNRLVQNSTDLDQLIQLYGMREFKSDDAQEKKAFYINAYNLFVIDRLTKSYPAQSPQEIAGFFTAKNHLILGNKISLDQLEKEYLSSQEDPRLHFVLVCGAMGCPPIANFAFKAAVLDSLIESQTRVAINDTNFIRIEENKIGLSQIFKWYVSDFTQDSKQVLDFINTFRNEKIPISSFISYYEYDWSINSSGEYASNSLEISLAKSNLQLFTPSALFSLGEFEIHSFNSIYFQNSIRNNQGEEIKLGQSQAFFNSLVQITSGLPKTKRLNVGLDINITAARYGAPDENPIDFFNDETTIFRKAIISSLGPRIKYIPFEKFNRLSIQSTFLFPVANNQETPLFIAHDRFTWFTQLFFDQSIGEHFQVFLEADLLYRFNRNSTNENNFFRTPLSAFISYFPTSKSTIYGFTQYSPRYEMVILSDGDQFGLSQWFWQLGIGSKYQITPKLGIELSYANFINSSNDGAGYSVNLGVRYIHR